MKDLWRIGVELLGSKRMESSLSLEEKELCNPTTTI